MLLKVGSTGDDVKKLQTKLGVNADGIFGEGTEKLVKEWQTKNKLTSDGIVGDDTWKLMFGELSINDTHQNGTGALDILKLKNKISELLYSQIIEVAPKFNITTNLRLAHFLSQCSHESGGFKITQENLNYSADGLKNIFPKYFPGNLNESYARNPQKIANKVYASRMGNGDENSGDGYKFRGRGYIQMTGKENYSKFSHFIGEDCVANPDLVSTKYPLASAAFFFNSNNLWTICDKGADEATVTAVTKRVNGGTIGLSERLKEFNHFYSLFL